jgi:ATP synthase protein I
MTEPNQEGRRMMEDAVERRQSRRDRWEREGERPLWKNLSMVGALGWLIVTPTLIGVFAGRWLDGRLDTGVTFSGALTFLGACLGFWLAWTRMNEE